MGTGDIALRGNPAMDQCPVQGGVAMFLGMLHAKETRDKLWPFWPLTCVCLCHLPLPRIEIMAY